MYKKNLPWLGGAVPLVNRRRISPFVLSGLMVTGLLATPSLAAMENNISLELGWDSLYITEGRDNLSGDGITWGVLTLETGQLSSYVALGRGDHQDYTELNVGAHYLLALHPDLEATIGLQRLEFYGDERASDNELFAELAYLHWAHLVPSLSSVYSTEAEGFFVELKLTGNWQPSERWLISPYIAQGLDYGYATASFDGRNHVQLGVEAQYFFNDQLVIRCHLGHSIAGRDIRLEMAAEASDQTFGGIHLNWAF